MRPHRGYAFWTALPWFLTAALAVVLVFKVIPDRAIKQSSLLADAWLKWQTNLAKTSGQCSKFKDKVDKAKDGAEKDAAEKARDQCLADKLPPVIEARPERRSDAPSLTSDLMAGHVMVNDVNVGSVLHDRLSIDEEFLGSGRSEPVGGKDYKDASVPEYLVPNLSDGLPNVWVWKLEQLQNQKPVADQNLLEVLLTFPLANTQANHPDFESAWKGWLKDHLRPDDPRPVLVRFAFLYPQDYSGCLGRLKATRVFMSNLGELTPRTLGDAAQSTGRKKPDKSDDQGLKIFIWVYAPTTESGAIPATWGNVLANFGKWIIAKPCKNPN